MKGNAADVSIDTNITYSLKTNSFNKHLKLVNKSAHTYVFKIKTNQKTVVSLQTTHDFIKPNTVKQIAIKLADKPSQTGALKLQFNYALASDQDITNNDSKMNSYPKDSTFKKIITIERKDDPEGQQQFYSKTQKIDLQFSSPVKIEKQTHREINYPSIDLTKSQVVKISNQSLDKSQEFDITELIKMEKSASLEINKIQESSKNKEVLKQISKKIQISPQPTSSKKNSVKQPQKQQKSTTNLLESSSKDYNTFVAMQAEGNNDNTFRMTQSVVVDIPAEPLSKKNEKQIVIAELNEKIEKERNAIRNLQAKNPHQSIIYPLPLIIGLIVVFFCLGSALSWALNQL